MSHNLQRLIYLCHIKNELNRKRRRFYYYINHFRTKEKWNPKTSKYEKVWIEPKHFSLKEAEAGYYLAQKQMKEMTKEMGKMRVEMGCRFIWNVGGLITHIEFPSGGRLKQQDFKKYYEAEIFEMELFDGQE